MFFHLLNRGALVRRFLTASLVIVALVAAPLVASSETESRPNADGKGERSITLIHLNDLHANLIPHLDLVRIVPGGRGKPFARAEMRGGIARIATLVRRIRRKNPASLLMNVGDTYHGGVEALYTRGNAIVPAVNALGIDVGVPGNWDFAYGAVTTRLRYQAKPPWVVRLLDGLFFPGKVERPNFPNLAANLRQTMPPSSSGELLLPATMIIEVEGVRVGFVGLTSDIVPRMASPFAWGFDFLEGEENYRTLIDELAAELRSEGALAVVVMSELGLHRDKRLADIIAPGVDVFFSAHTHEVTPKPLESRSGAVLVEAGNDGYLGQMDLKFRSGKLVGHDWRLWSVNADIPEDADVAALVREARAPFLADVVEMDYPAPWVELPLDRRIDTVVGHTDHVLHRRDVLHNPFNNLLADVILRAAGTQVSMTPGFRFDAVVLPAGSSSGQGGDEAPKYSGEITIEQIYRYLPIAPSLAIGEIRGEDLREILEVELTRVFSSDAFDHSGGWLGSFGGLDLEVDLSRPNGERVQSVRLRSSSEEIGDDEILTVASCVRPFDEEGVMCSNPSFRNIREFENPGTGRAWTPLELLITAFEAEGVKTMETQSGRIADRSGSLPWPATAYIQPLRIGKE